MDIHCYTWLFLVFLAIPFRGLTGFFENRCLLLCILVGYFIAKKFAAMDIITCFVKVMVVVSTIALVCYAINNYVFPMTWLPQEVNSNDISFSVGYVYNFITLEPERNCGPFWEPGIYATWLVLALVFLNYVPKIKHRLLCNVILILSIISTVSAAGYLLLFISGALLSLRIVKISKTAISYLVPVLFIFGAVFFVSTGGFENLISENEYLSELQADSLFESSRILAINQNLDLFIQRPVFGFGQSYVIANTVDVANTASTFYMLSAFGVLGLSFTTALLWGVFKQKKLHVIEKILIAIIFLIIINKEGQYDFILNWVIAFMLLSSAEVLESRFVDKGEGAIGQFAK